MEISEGGSHVCTKDPVSGGTNFATSGAESIYARIYTAAKTKLNKKAERNRVLLILPPR
jgi:hypothetical protein